MQHLNDPIILEVPHRIVLTGGPLAGKSTVMRHLQKLYANKARFMTEVASMLLTNGYPQPGKDVNYSEHWLDYINRVILPTQINMENGHLHAAHSNRMPAVFYDRGILDVSAYVPSGKTALVERYGMNIEHIHARYSMVIHLQSLACYSADQYRTLQDTNPARYESPADAIKRDADLIDAWGDHPNWNYIQCDGGISNVIQRVLDLVSPLLDIEIERKWRLDRFPSLLHSNLPQNIEAVDIQQYYIYNSDSSELRLRITNDIKSEITIKDKESLARKEWQTDIPMEIAKLFTSDAIPMVKKIRSSFVIDGILHEIDRYQEPIDLITLECEFNTQKQANEYLLPNWIAECGAVEVTNDSAYKNANLAKIQS